MAEVIELACHCGAVRLAIRDSAPLQGICYCVDCQAFARHLGAAGRVCDEAGGTRLFQTAPQRVDILQGAGDLRVLRLSPKGLFRWYAGCCDTPLCNTPSSPKISIASFMVANVTAGHDALGRQRFRYKTDQARVAQAEKDKGLFTFVARVARLILSGRINNRWRNTPFFSQTGQPIATPDVISREDRAAAYSV